MLSKYEKLYTLGLLFIRIVYPILPFVSTKFMQLPSLWPVYPTPLVEVIECLVQRLELDSRTRMLANGHVV